MSETLQQYDRWSATYDREDNPMIGATGWALEQVPFECRGAEVVEIGCGTGRHVAPVLDAGARAYVGIDGSPGMLAVARRQYRDPRVQFVEADIGAGVPLGDRAFDRALTVLVLEHIADLDAPFREIARLLRQGGRLRIIDIHPSLVAAGTVAHFHEGGEEVRFASFAHPVPVLTASLARAGLAVDAVRQVIAEGALLERVPKMSKHRGHPVLVDIDARRTD